ncbi:HXXXD-type acyl-transferase family protein [Striga asiatica]|uniref:HXXXD-type acyl-transferase family protein n=1 Tax=Striga asiatica TaxID=4170 RepID=A0A5A7QXU2_STRAF|nr:HXXXD-type acyl-transferase family protein [Striga asiatica]
MAAEQGKARQRIESSHRPVAILISADDGEDVWTGKGLSRSSSVQNQSIFSHRYSHLHRNIPFRPNLARLPITLHHSCHKRIAYLLPASILAMLPLLFATKTSLSSQTIKSSAAMRDEKDENGAISSLLAIVSLVWRLGKRAFKGANVSSPP